MPTSSPSRLRTLLHQRGTTALVLSREDRTPELADPRPGEPQPTTERRRWWPTVLVWIFFGAVIAALWALLLLGDSFVVT